MKKYFFPFLFCVLFLGCKKKYLAIIPTVSLEQIASPVSENLHSIYFLSPLEGFVSGVNGNIYKTNNGGSSWTNISLLNNTVIVKKVLFTTSLIGFCLTTDGIFRTLDGGASWISTLNLSGFSDIQFVTPNIGYAVGGDFIHFVYKTTNGGNTWIPKYHPPGIDNPFNAVSFINKDTGYATVNEKRIYETTNGGTSWTMYKSDDYIYKFSDLIYTGYRTGYVVGEIGYLVYNNSSDLSCDENLISKNFYSYNINAIAYRSGRAVAVGVKSVLMPYNDPESEKFKWHYFLSPEGTTIPYTYNDVMFSDDNTFFAVGNGGVITKFKYP